MIDPPKYRYSYVDNSPVPPPSTGVIAGDAPQPKDPCAEWIRLDDDDFRTKLDRVRTLVECAERTPLWADDLLRIARAVYLVDKRTDRADGYDTWTRDLELAVQVADPEPWNEEVRTCLAELLRVLTADEWKIDVFGGATPIDSEPRLSLPVDSLTLAEEITLFSGGLDSTAYLASRAREPGGPLLWVGHGGPAALQQKELHSRVDRLKAPGRELLCGQVLDQAGAEDQPKARGNGDPERPKDGDRSRFEGRYVVGGGPKGENGDSRLTRAGRDGRSEGAQEGDRAKDGKALESSSRSRGFLYAATAIFVAAAHGVRRVAMPENGQLALNPPLTPDRIAAFSTRSVHPWVVDRLNRLIDAVGGNVEVYNPFLYLTKGEVCRIAREAGLRDDDLAATVSCGNHPAQRRQGNCGYCYPCLIRRSGLLASGGDPTRYQKSGFDGRHRQKHLADLQSWLARPFGARDVIADMPLPPDVSLAKVTDTLQRGREELRAMLRALGAWVP